MGPSSRNGHGIYFLNTHAQNLNTLEGEQFAHHRKHFSFFNPFRSSYDLITIGLNGIAVTTPLFVESLILYLCTKAHFRPNQLS